MSTYAKHARCGSHSALYPSLQCDRWVGHIGNHRHYLAVTIGNQSTIDWPQRTWLVGSAS